MKKKIIENNGKKTMKKCLTFGLCAAAAVFMIACGTDHSDPKEKADAKESVDAKGGGKNGTGNGKMTGEVELSGTSKEELTGGVKADCTTTLKVDFDAMEAVLTIDCNMPVGDDGTTMLFTLADEKKGEDATRYMQCMEMGKGKLTDQGDGTYLADWKFTVEGASEPMEYTITITEDGEGGCTAEVPFEGLFAEPVKLTQVKE